MTDRTPRHPLPAQLRSRLHRAAATMHTLADHIGDDLDPGLCELVGEMLNDEVTDDLFVLAGTLGAVDALGLRVAFTAAPPPPSLNTSRDAVRRGTIERAESGMGVGVRSALRIARALDATVETLFGGCL